MNCRQIKDELLLLVGADGIAQDIQKHLDACPECRAFWSELKGVSDSLGSDEDFYLDETVLESAVARVDASIDRLELKKVTDVRSAWFSYVPAAAAVILLVGISISAYLLGWFPSASNQAGVPSQDSVWVSLENGDFDIVENSNFEYVVYQSTTSADLLYDDLTEEELEYLDENFDVGEIL